MDPSSPNAFARSNEGGVNGLAAMLRPMEAALHETTTGSRLELSPMHAGDALRALVATERTELLISHVVQSAWSGPTGPLELREVCRRLGIAVVAEIDGAVILRPAAALRLLGTVPTTAVTVTCVDGPVEARDARAILAAIDRGACPLEIELRANDVLRVRDDRVVDLAGRRRETLLSIIAEDFRLYVSALLRDPDDVHGAPETWQIERLLDESGYLTVRPIESEIYSTSIDVGIGTVVSPTARPATRSLVYDRPSRTWHDEA
jgi:hypothetical protein